MTRLTDFLVLALVVALAWAGGCGVERSRAERQAEMDRMVTRQVIDSLALQTAKIDTVFARDTVRLATWRTRWDTVRSERTLRLTDTVWVRAALAVADSTVTACTEALQTCATRGALLAVQRDSLAALTVRLRQPPPRFGCTVGLTYTVGDLTERRRWDDLASRAGVTCGWRVRVW